MSNAKAAEIFQALLRTNGAQPPGYKVAINFAAAQHKLGLSHALAAPLPERRPLLNAAQVSFPADSKLHVEAEIAITLGVDIRAPLPLEPIRAAVESYAPCLELVDYALPRNDLAAMFAHSFFHAGYLLGAKVPSHAFRSLAPELPSVSSTTGQLRTRTPGSVPDDVVLALQALSERVLEAGGALYAGQVVLCGSYIEPVPLAAGDTLRADFGPLGVLTVTRG